MSAVTQAVPAATQYNPYLEDNSNISNNAAAWIQSQTAFIAPGQPVKSSQEEYVLC
jgi:hypothetical protein